jgi:hypothetical protein
MDLLTTDWQDSLQTLVRGTTKSVLFMSPFITDVALDLFEDLLQRNVNCRLITRFNPVDFWRGVSDAEVLHRLAKRGVIIKSRRGLHAKAYFFDGNVSVITSANLTRGGVATNYELGLQFTKGECLGAFREAETLWDSLKETFSPERIKEVLDKLQAYKEKHPTETSELPHELADQSEVPEDEQYDEIRLKSDINDNTVGPAIGDLRRAHEQVDRGSHIGQLEAEIDRSGDCSISLQSYLWLAGWCHTDPSKKRTAMARAQDLALELFGYVPPEYLETEGRRYRLKEYRYGRRVPFAEEIVSKHLDWMSEARAPRVGSQGSATQVLGDRDWRHSLANRERDFTLFQIPKDVRTKCAVEPNTKRFVQIRLSTGARLGGFCTITSGTELRIPAEQQPLFREAAFFECSIVGDERSDEVTLSRL